MSCYPQIFAINFVEDMWGEKLARQGRAARWRFLGVGLPGQLSVIMTRTERGLPAESVLHPVGLAHWSWKHWPQALDGPALANGLLGFKAAVEK